MGDEDEVVYLFLPLAHAFAKLVRLRDGRLRRRGRLLGEGPAEDRAQPRRGEADVLPVRAADVREDLHAGHQRGARSREARAGRAARREGPSDAGRAARTVPAELQAAFDGADEALYKNVRAIFGGRIRQCVTGAAPIAQEILEFFYACGVPVMEGYGMTETVDRGDRQRAGRLPLRLGRQAAPGDRGQGGRGRRDPPQGPEHLQGLLQERGGHERDAGRRLAPHRRPGRGSTRTASSSSPVARRTSSSPRAARTSRPPTSRTASSRTAGSRRPWWSATAGRT